MKIRPCLVGLFAALPLHVAYSQNATPSGTFKIWPVRSNSALQNPFYPLETVDDPQGLTAQVGGPAMVTANGNVCCNAGSPSNGLIYWNPVTNLFKFYPVPLGGPQFTVDLNRSIPSSGPPTFGGGDAWGAASGGVYVNFRGTDNFRFWGLGGINAMGIRVDDTKGKVSIALPEGSGLGGIVQLDPATNQYKRWRTGSSP